MLYAFPATSFTALPFSSFGGMSDPVLRLVDITRTIARNYMCPKATWTSGSVYTSYFAAACSFLINFYTAIGVTEFVQSASRSRRNFVGTSDPKNAAPISTSARRVSKLGQGSFHPTTNVNTNSIILSFQSVVFSFVCIVEPQHKHCSICNITQYLQNILKVQEIFVGLRGTNVI